jgi:tripartite-type tricarboxylate transporter receptor subunit TctC
VIKAIAAAFGACMLVSLAPAFGQAYPVRPIRLIVPFGPGGGSDFAGRLIGQKLTEQMGQQVVVDNRAGAASLVGTEIVMRAPPDGYTLLLADSGLTINPAYYKNATYNPVKDFEPIGMIAETPYTLIVNAALPYGSTLRDFVSAVKAQPGKLRIGSAGNGSGTHFSGELFRLKAGLNMIHVPYKGGGAMLADVTAGHIESAMATPAITLPLVKSGRIRMLAQALPKRSPSLPDVPTFSEAGVPDVFVSNWYGIISPRGTPQTVVRRLNAEINKAIAAPDMRERFVATELDATPTTPDEFRKRLGVEVERWKNMMKDAGIRPE